MRDTPSDPPPTDPPVDPNVKHRQIAYYEIVKHLREKLPFTDTMSDTDRTRMLAAAISDVRDLQPATGFEARLAACAVAALSHDDLCTAQVTCCLEDIRLTGKLRAQSASMGSQARGYLNTLAKLQATRIKRDGDDKTCESGAWAEHYSESSLRQAAEQLPAEPTPVPQPVWTEPPRPQRAAGRFAPPAQRAVFEPEPERTEEDLRRARLVHDVDMYTVVYPLRARVIRRLGGMPPDAPFEAPEPEVMAELLVANRSNQEWVDGMTPEQVMIDGGHDRMGWPYEPDADPDVVRAALLRAGVDWRPGLPWGALSAASVGM
jgi:hypothetical protein